MSLGFCRFAVCPLRSHPKDSAEMVSQVLFGELVTILEREKQWVRIRCEDKYEGYADYKFFHEISEKEASEWKELRMRNLNRNEFVDIQNQLIQIPIGAFVSSEDYAFDFGILKGSLITHEVLPRTEIAKMYRGSSYLWGGKTPWGIDCSGFTQMVLAFEKIELPRDAYQQAEIGQLIDFKDKEAGDLVFFTTTSEKITHVGLMISERQIIHAHGSIRIDELQNEGIYQSEEQRISHHFHSIRRID